MINTWNESLLHEELKDRYCGDSGAKEVPLEGSICDVVCADGLIVEVQTANLGKLKNKLDKLLEHHQVKLVYPIARNTIIETYSPDGTLQSRRKSPKHETVYSVFSEFTRLWPLIGHANLILEIVHADILELRIADGTGSWRRKGIRKEDKKLMRVHETTLLSGKKDWAELVQFKKDEEFSVKDLQISGAGKHAGKMAWVLRKAGIIEQTGKRGNAFIYRKTGRKRKAVTSVPE